MVRGAVKDSIVKYVGLEEKNFFKNGFSIFFKLRPEARKIPELEPVSDFVIATP